MEPPGSVQAQPRGTTPGSGRAERDIPSPSNRWESPSRPDPRPPRCGGRVAEEPGLAGDRRRTRSVVRAVTAVAVTVVVPGVVARAVVRAVPSVVTAVVVPSVVARAVVGAVALVTGGVVGTVPRLGDAGAGSDEHHGGGGRSGHLLDPHDEPPDRVTGPAKVGPEEG